jgi:hypothetical protein
MIFSAKDHASAQTPGPVTASDLYDFCIDVGFAPSQAACKFYILGVVGATSVVMNDHRKFEKNERFCMPSEVTSEEMVAVFKRVAHWQFEHFPEDKQIVASGFVVGMLTTLYPCKK